MAETKFTPGPWYYQEEPYDGSGVYLIGHDGLTVAECRSFNPEADTRLIAAAPALYEALSDLIRSYEALVRTARDRIIDLGGDCDPAPRLIASDPALIEARSALILANTGGTENG